MNTAYLGLGTNIGDKMKNLQSAVDALEHLPSTDVAAVSAVYETEPWGYLDQDNFYNICVKIETALSPSVLLGACLGAEAAFGRERPFKNSPRIMDIDVLLYNTINTNINSGELILPHPRMHERAFVLVPLKDVLPELKIGDLDLNTFFDSCDKSGIIKTNHIIEIK